MGLTVTSLRHGITRILETLEAQHQTLTELDGKIGDGDLGITLLKAFRELNGVKDSLPDDVGQALLQCAGAVSRVSSSSFGTLLATSLIAAAKATKGSASIAWTEMPNLMNLALQAMAARGKASLGDKTVLDALSAASQAASLSSEPQALAAAARQGIEQALNEFRNKPNKIGRARIYADRTIGVDDPGMVALKVMTAALE